MVAIPVEGTWSVRLLGEDDRIHVLDFLEREPLLNVYLISKVFDYGLGGAVPFLEVTHEGETVCIASAGSNIVIAADRVADEVRDTALEMLAGRVITRHLPVRAIISEAVLVERFWRSVRPHVDPPTVIRLDQPVYALRGGRELPDLDRVRFATLDDLDKLVFASAAMHREEVGIDPLVRDSYGYRQRVRELVERRRSVVLVENGEIVFKCEFSAVTKDAIQLMGVWTAPARRRAGFARAGMVEVCGHIARQEKTTTLFVNDFNAAAIRLYESLGFERIGHNRALIW